MAYSLQYGLTQFASRGEYYGRHAMAFPFDFRAVWLDLFWWTWGFAY